MLQVFQILHKLEDNYQRFRGLRPFLTTHEGKLSALLIQSHIISIYVYSCAISLVYNFSHNNHNLTPTISRTWISPLSKG